MISRVLYLAALLSIVLSVVVYNYQSETLGTFIGLWVPTLLLLSDRHKPNPFASFGPWGSGPIDSDQPL